MALACLLLMPLGLVGCSNARTTADPGASATAGAASPNAATAGATTAATSVSGARPTLPGQTDTDWGRIWDAVPESFPVVPGAAAATDTGEGASSALLAVGAPGPAEIATFYGNGLQRLGMAVSVDGPLEDGSVTVSGTDGYGCAVRVTVRPTGTTKLVSVLYGAGCPF